ncbi:10181_t:CDS:1, partial [Racocetra fulgida]
IKLRETELETHRTNTQLSDLQCKLGNAMNDNEMLQRKAAELKKLVEKQENQDNQVMEEEKELIDKDKEIEIRELRKKLADEREERNKTGTRFKLLEQLISKAEEQKEQLLQEHKIEIQKLQQQHEEEINNLSAMIQTRIESLEKKQRARISDRGEAKKIAALEKKIIELDKLLQTSEAEREKLQNEKNELDNKFQEVSGFLYG